MNFVNFITWLQTCSTTSCCCVWSGSFLITHQSNLASSWVLVGLCPHPRGLLRFGRGHLSYSVQVFEGLRCFRKLFRIINYHQLSSIIINYYQFLSIITLCITLFRIINFYRTRVRSLAIVSNSLTNSLTDSCLVNLIIVSLACEDGNSKLVDTDVDSLTHSLTD